MWTSGIGINIRSALFSLFTISCIDSSTRSDIILGDCRQPIKAIPRAREIPVAASLPSASEDMNIQQEAKEKRDNRIPTIHDRPLLLDKTINNLEGLSGSRPTLVQREPIQPLDRRFDVLLSPELPKKFL